MKTPNDFIGNISVTLVSKNLNCDSSAMYWSKKAIDKGFTEISRITNYPYLDHLKDDERYNQLLGYMKSKVDSIKTEANNNYPEYFDCN